jgi:hypothetical protein
MSSENEQELAQNANANQTNEHDAVKEIERLTVQNERLLYESQKYKTRKSDVDTLQAKLDAYENKKLEEEGNWQERLRLEQERTAELNGKLKTQQEKILKSNVYNAVQRVANDAYDVNDLLAQSDYVKMIEVNEDTLEPVAESVEKFVNSLKAEKEYFFKGKKVASMADSKPAIDRPQAKNISQMTESEKSRAFSDAIAAAFKPRN